MKRALLVSAAVIVLLGLAAAWFVTSFERVPTKVWTGPSGAARANPYLAAMRFMERVGMQTSLIERVAELDAIAPGATLVLLAGRTSLSPERVQALQHWTQNGGHLVIEPERAGVRDAMLDALRIGRGEVAPGKPMPTLAVAFPGSAHSLRVTPGPRVALDLSRVQPEFSASDPAGTWFATLVAGAGRITVLTGLYRFQNRLIGTHDNAEFLRQILHLQPTSRQVYLLRPPQSLPLWEWLERHALGTMLAGGVLLALWLWRASPRFGPLRPAAAPERRQLLEHIRACGRFRWAEGARAALLDAAREICLRRIVLLQPSMAHLTHAQRNQVLATSADMDASSIAHAFDAAPRSTREFVQIVATLASIHDALGHAGRRRTPRRKRR